MTETLLLPAGEAQPRTKVLANGAVYSYETNRIVQAPPKDRQPITQVNASAYHELRNEKRIRAAQRAIMLETNAKSVVHGLIIMDRAMVRMALDTETYKRGSVEAYRAVTSAAGYGTADNGNGATITNNILAVDSTVLAALIREITGREDT